MVFILAFIVNSVLIYRQSFCSYCTHVATGSFVVVMVSEIGLWDLLSLLLSRAVLSWLRCTRRLWDWSGYSGSTRLRQI